MTKKQFIQDARIEEYTGYIYGKRVKCWVIYFDFKFGGEDVETAFRGYKYAIGGVSVTKKNTIDAAYNWIVKNDVHSMPVDFQYKDATTDKDRFKVRLTYPFRY